jgi:hypothetical protein
VHTLQVERAIRLALSKLNRIQVGQTLFGKIHIETKPSCVACNRPFSNEPGQFAKKIMSIAAKQAHHMTWCTIQRLAFIAVEHNR